MLPLGPLSFVTFVDAPIGLHWLVLTLITPDASWTGVWTGGFFELDLGTDTFAGTFVVELLAEWVGVGLV